MDRHPPRSPRLTAERFWDIGWVNLTEFIMFFLRPWAGHRIICSGDEGSCGDNPMEILTEEEQEELHDGVSEDEFNTDELGDYGQGEISLFKLARCRFVEIASDIDPHRVLLKTALDECSGLPPSKRRIVLNFAMTDISDYYPGNEIWILRNLTTHEFVRADELSVRSSQPSNGPHIGFPGLGEVILYRICWSSSPTGVSGGTGDIHRGFGPAIGSI